MPDDIILRDLESHVSSLTDTVFFLEKLYYNRSVVGIFKQQALSVMLAGARFVRDNLVYLRDTYKDQPG